MCIIYTNTISYVFSHMFSATLADESLGLETLQYSNHMYIFTYVLIHVCKLIYNVTCT